MKDLAVMLLMAGILLVVHAVYEEKARVARENPRIEYRFIPRDIYHDQFFTDKLAAYTKDLEFGSARDKEPLKWLA